MIYLKTQEVNIMATPTKLEIASAPPAYSTEGEPVKFQQWELKVFVQEKSLKSLQEMTHSEFEKRLWTLNAFIIPLIVYPILSLIGHIVLFFSHDSYNGAYREIDEYLAGKVKLLKSENYHLNDDDLVKITQIFRNRVFFDSRFKNDPFYLKLMDLDKPNPVITRAKTLLKAQVEKDYILFHAAVTMSAAKVEEVIKREFPHAVEWNRAILREALLERKELNRKYFQDLGSVELSRDPTLQAEMLTRTNFKEYVPELFANQVHYVY